MPILVNKSEISDDDIHLEMQYHPASNVELARQKASQALVIQELLVQAAIEKNYLKNGDAADLKATEKALDLMIEQEVSVPEADAETCERYYEQNKERFKDKKNEQILPFENVHTLIRDYLHARSLKTGISQYIQLLAGRARISGFDFEGADSPLVQ